MKLKEIVKYSIKNKIFRSYKMCKMCAAEGRYREFLRILCSCKL